MSLYMKSYSVTIQIKAIEQYFPLVVLILKSKDENRTCNHSSDSKYTTLHNRSFGWTECAQSAALRLHTVFIPLAHLTT